MDKNLVAFLDPSAYTIEVKFARSGKNYIYVANASHGTIVPGTLVVVPVGTVDTTSQLFDLSDMVDDERLPAVFTAPEFKVVEVTDVHDTVSISPDSDTEYNWIIGALDLSPWCALMQRNEQLQSMAEDAYKRNLRKSFAERVLGELDSATAGT